LNCYPVEVREQLQKTPHYMNGARRRDELHEKNLHYYKVSYPIDDSFPLPYNTRGNVWFEKYMTGQLMNIAEPLLLYEKRAHAYFNRERNA